MKMNTFDKLIGVIMGLSLIILFIKGLGFLAHIGE